MYCLKKCSQHVASLFVRYIGHTISPPRRGGHASARFAQVCMCRWLDGQRSPRQEAPLRWQVHNEARGGDNAHAQAQIAWPSRTPSLLASTPPLKLCAAAGTDDGALRRKNFIMGWRQERRDRRQ